MPERKKARKKERKEGRKEASKGVVPGRFLKSANRQSCSHDSLKRIDSFHCKLPKRIASRFLGVRNDPALQERVGGNGNTSNGAAVRSLGACTDCAAREGAVSAPDKRTHCLFTLHPPKRICARAGFPCPLPSLSLSLSLSLSRRSRRVGEETDFALCALMLARTDRAT